MKRILSIQSNVVYGYAGNKVAVFPMQLLGVDVFPIHTVQLSSNTVYKHYDGFVFPDQQITRIIDSLEKIGVLDSIDAVISGYIGTAQQGDEILYAVDKIRSHNPNLIYVCDPVMGGDIDKGTVVKPEIVDFFVNRATRYADYITPNLVELQALAGRELTRFDDVLEILKEIQQTHCQQIIVKNLLHAGQNRDQFEMVFANKDHYWHHSRPLYEFDFRPLGVGDLICAVFTAQLMQLNNELKAFEFAGNVADEVLKKTYELGVRELAVIESQEQIKHPSLQYKVTQLL